MKRSLDKYPGEIISSYPSLYERCNDALSEQHRVWSYTNRWGRTILYFIIISHTRISTDGAMMCYLGNIMSELHGLYIIISHTRLSRDGAMMHYLSNIMSGLHWLSHIYACIIRSPKDKSTKTHGPKPLCVFKRTSKALYLISSLYHYI